MPPGFRTRCTPAGRHDERDSRLGGSVLRVGGDGKQLMKVMFRASLSLALEPRCRFERLSGAESDPRL